MFEKIIAVQPLENYILRATFKDGRVKEFDMKPEIESRAYYSALRDNPELFSQARPIGLGSAIGWNDEIDMASEWIWDHGKEIPV